MTTLDAVYAFFLDGNRADEQPSTDAMMLAIADELRTANLLHAASFYAGQGGPGYKLSRRYAQAAADRLPAPPPFKES